jgi:hypothetical protein
MTRAKRVKSVTVKVAKSFDGVVIGEQFDADLTERVLALISGGFLEVVDYGAGEAGPGAADASDPGREPTGDQPESAAGAEPGEGPGAG